MPKAARLNDIGSAHGCYPPTNIIAASPNVFINNIPAARVGDPLAPHGCSKCPPHSRAIAQGSASVFINGIPAARMGDAIACGGSIMTASPNVIIGDSGGGIVSTAVSILNLLQSTEAEPDPVTQSARLEGLRNTLLNARQEQQAFCVPCQQSDSSSRQNS